MPTGQQARDAIFYDCQLDYSIPPTWLDASRRLQYVTGSEVGSNGTPHDTPDLDGGPLVSSVDLSSQCDSQLQPGLHDTQTTDVFGNHFGYHNAF